MRILLALAATLAPVLACQAEAQVSANQTAAQPQAARVTPDAAAFGLAELPAAKPIARRVHIRPQPQEHRLGQLTLPSVQITAPLSLGANAVFPPSPGVPANPLAGPAAEPETVGAPIAAVQAETLSTSPDASGPKQPVADIAAQAIPASGRAFPAPGSVPIEAVAGAAEPTILLRTDSDVGLAAFRAGPDMLVVLDQAIDFQAPGFNLAPAFARLTSRRTQDATVIRIPVAAGTLGVTRSPSGWLITVGSPDATTSIVPRLIKSGSTQASIQFPASEPSRVVTVVNPQTGDRLLVGTQRVTGQAVPNEWQQPKFSLVPTVQGVAVGAISDDIRLHPDAGGFTLSSGPQADSSIVQNAANQASNAPIAGAISRLFDIPSGTVVDLGRELDARIAAAGSAHALARSEPRLRVAEAMLGLGMDIEAQSVVDAAAADDPALIDMPLGMGLRAVASTLAGRFEDAKTLGDPRLTGSTEIDFWRAFLRAAQDEASADDARALSGGLPLVLAYPQILRESLLPVTLEAMALNGQAEAAQAILKTHPDDRALDLARGLALEMTNRSADAIGVYDRVAKSDDRLRSYKALVRATELRIKGGTLDAKAGADTLDRALYGWRGAKQEIALRMHVAALRQQAGQWQEALTVLRDGRRAYPEDHAQIDQQMAEVFTALINDDSVRNLTPSAFAALYDENIRLVQDILWTERTGTALVDRLTGLGLQSRAEPLLTRLVSQTNNPVRRAVLGERLADLRMTMDNPAGAIAALADTAPPADVTMDRALVEARQLLYARGEGQRGNTDTALAMLGTLDSAEADTLRADIYAARKDWPQTIVALTAWESKGISSTDDLTPQQQGMVMRLAEAATLSADAATLQRLAATYGDTMDKGSSASLFRLLTSAPVVDETDLPRAFADINLARQVEGALNSAPRR